MDTDLAVLAAQIAGVAALAAAPTFILTEMCKPLLFGRSRFYRPLSLVNGVVSAMLVMAALAGYTVAMFVLAGIAAAGAASGTYWKAKDMMGGDKSKPVPVGDTPRVQVDGTRYVPESDAA